MQKIKKFFSGGIQHKLFRLVFITTLLTVVAFISVIMYQSKFLTRLANETAQEQQDSFSGLASVTMNEIIVRNLETDADMEAYIANDVFEELENSVSALGTYAARMLESPELWPPDYIPEPDPSLDGVTCAQLLAEDGVDLEDPAIKAEAGFLGNMSDLMISLFDSSSQLNSCFIGSPSGFFIIADDRSGAKFDENGQLLSFPVTERPWYKGAVEKGDIFFTDVETDAFTGAIGVVCSMPVYDNGKLVAVVGADLFLTSMEEAVVASDQNGSFVFIVNQNGHVVFSPKQSGVLMVQPAESALDLRECEETELAAFVKKALAGKTKARTIHYGNTDYYMAGAPLNTVGWALITVINKETTQRPARLMQYRNNEIKLATAAAILEESKQTSLLVLLLALVIFLLATIGAYILGKRIVMPLEKMTKRVTELGGDNILFEMDDDLKTGDEIEILAKSYSDLSKETMNYIEEVRSVTAEKERIGAELGMAKAIQESQLPSIFPAYPNRKEFDLFATMTPAKEVGGDFYDFFLVDNDHLALVMADVAGKGVPAALFMMISKILIKNRLLAGETPGAALENVNNQLMDGNETEMFVTVWLAVLTISTGQGVAVNAGHEHPTLKRKDGEFELIKYPHSPALGIMDGLRFKEHSFEMRPGDTLFVYTDGVPEATNSSLELLGPDRMLAALNSAENDKPKSIMESVRRGIDEFVGGAEQFDDITMLCLTYKGPEA